MFKYSRVGWSYGHPVAKRWHAERKARNVNCLQLDWLVLISGCRRPAVLRPPWCRRLMTWTKFSAPTCMTRRNRSPLTTFPRFSAIYLWNRVRLIYFLCTWHYIIDLQALQHTIPFPDLSHSCGVVRPKFHALHKAAIDWYPRLVFPSGESWVCGDWWERCFLIPPTTPRYSARYGCI